MQNMKNKLVLIISSSATLGLLLMASAVSAQTIPNGQPGRGGHMMGSHPSGVFGTISAVNGTTITVNSKGFGPNATQTTYSVDASSAIIIKDGATSTLSSVAVGDMVMIAGTTSGTNVAANVIRDGRMGRPGMMGRGMGEKNNGNNPTKTPPTPPFQGNGQPIIAGTIAAINGSSLTITNKSNVTYTVDGSSATVIKTGASSTLANVAIGDNVVIQGAVNGTAVTASSIIDQGNVYSTTPPTSHLENNRLFGNVFGSIGGFFKHLFGF